MAFISRAIPGMTVQTVQTVQCTTVQTVQCTARASYSPLAFKQGLLVIGIVLFPCRVFPLVARGLVDSLLFLKTPARGPQVMPTMDVAVVRALGMENDMELPSFRSTVFGIGAVCNTSSVTTRVFKKSTLRSWL